VSFISPVPLVNEGLFPLWLFQSGDLLWSSPAFSYRSDPSGRPFGWISVTFGPGAFLLRKQSPPAKLFVSRHHSTGTLFGLDLPERTTCSWFSIVGCFSYEGMSLAKTFSFRPFHLVYFKSHSLPGGVMVRGMDLLQSFRRWFLGPAPPLKEVFSVGNYGFVPLVSPPVVLRFYSPLGQRLHPSFS